MRAFIDLLFSMMIIFCALFMMSFLQITKSKTEAEVKKPPVELLVNMSWPDDIEVDIDLHMQSLEAIINFQSKERGYTTLERDDLGIHSDTIVLPDGEKVQYPHNHEVMSVRKLIDGRYIIAAHYYNPKQFNKPVPVTIRVDLMNPKVKTIFIKTHIIAESWDEKTFVILEIADGKVIHIDTTTQEPIVSEAILQQALESSTRDAGGINDR